MIKNWLIVLLVFLSAGAMAQVPGYMGLKFSVKYDAGIMEPPIVGRTGVLPMLYNNVSADYVVSRYVSVGIKYCFMTYNAPPQVSQFSDGLYNPADYKGRFTEHTVAIIVKRFFKRSGFIAPVGRYLTFGAYYQHAVSKEATTYLNGDNITYDNVIPPQGFKGTAEYGGIILGCGRNFVVANRMLIDFGFNVNVPLAIPGEITASKTLTVYNDVVLRNLLQIYLGLGVLAF